jgi:transketolase
MVAHALQAAELLAKEGIQSRVINLHTLKPIDRAAILQAARDTGAIVTAEEHTVIGGLGSAVAEWLSDREPAKARLCRIGGPDAFLHEAGEQEHARQRFGLDAQGIVRRVLARL